MQRSIAWWFATGSWLFWPAGGCSRAAPPVSNSAPAALAQSSSNVTQPGAVASVPAGPPAPSPLKPPPGYFVVARGRSTSGTWLFDLEAIDGRTLVLACLAGVTNGCVEPRLRELSGAGWVAVPELLRGLPELGWVNLQQEPGSPWQQVDHKSDQVKARDGCPSQPFFSGVRSLELVGEWPGNAWAVVDEVGEEWAMRTSSLYRWTEDRFVEIHRTKRVADFFEGVVPWREGVAALELALAPSGQDKLRIVSFSGKTRSVLTELPSDSLSSAALARLGQALVLSGVRDNGTVELFAWTAPGAAQRYKLRSSNTYSGVVFGNERGTVYYQAAGETYEAVEVAFEGKWREVGRRTLDEAGLETLTGADKERLVSTALGMSVERVGTRQSQSWLFVREAEATAGRGHQSWLLADQAPPSTWELSDEPVREPTRPPDRPGCPVGPERPGVR
jgi:hypothetical protein